MVATEKAALVRLEKIRWKQGFVASGGGDPGPPTFSPYLWTIFFKLDGATVRMADTGNLEGTATVESAQGTHGGLGIWSMNVGQTVIVPDGLGFWSTELIPIPIDLAIQPIFNSPTVPTPPATFGCIAILLRDGGHIPGHAVDAGRAALTNNLQTFLNGQLVEKLGVLQSEISDADLKEAQKNISDAIVDAMKDSMSTLEKIWALSGKDEFVASWTIIANAGESSWPANTPGADSLSGYGIFELSASVTITDPCPAEAVSALIEAVSKSERPRPAPAEGPAWSPHALEAMRDFRDRGGLRKRPGLRLWWRTARSHAAEISFLVARDKKLQRAFTTLLKSVPGALKATKKPLGKEQLEALRMVLDHCQKDGSARLKGTAFNARLELERLGDLPLGQLLDRLGAEAIDRRKVGTKKRRPTAQKAH